MDGLINDIREIEFNKIEYNKGCDNYFGFREGDIPVLLSAPHGAKHFRNGEWKEEDEYTSSIAIKLGEITGAHVIYVKNKTYEDSNYLEKTRYKEKIKKIITGYAIKFLADIHGADKSRPFKICVGTMYDDLKKCSCPTYMGVIEGILKDFQELPIFNWQGFEAKGDGTVTSFARKECGIESAQFEINANYRVIERKPDSARAMQGRNPDFRAEERDVLGIFYHLKDMILRINRKIKEES